MDHTACTEPECLYKGVLFNKNPVDWDGRDILCERMKTDYLKWYYGQTMEGNENLIDQIKMD